MLSELDQFYLTKEEPLKGCLLALREIILALDSNISTSWRYKAPFFLYKGKSFCYLWLDKKTREPYIGIIEGNKIDHPLLEKGNRVRMKILRIKPNQDLPIDSIQSILNQALGLCKVTSKQAKKLK
ncbi:DUF1801 domain-containing protein [Xanthovirga aplysinae]|uniref:DUF1801 domain-containing protein n=1 Tax=Xanthovirga aplysinae TaxID=2529853 RepID=UPI0012BD4764|nr:DUF1801 domain-containing protein [Xanthovirga aplysinae]MTI31997.1 DUF1801 domain-containing protein [Xanthovirga aplysinae]